MADPARNPDSRDSADVEPGHRSATGTPRWVKVFGIILAVLVLLFIFAVLFGDGPLGGHGPGRHTGASNAGGQEPTSVSADLGRVGALSGHEPPE